MLELPEWTRKTNDPETATQMRRMGMKIQLVVGDEAEEVPFWACRRGISSPYVPQNQIQLGICPDCRVRIYWRKTAPKKPPKVCLRCAFKRDKVEITPEIDKWIKERE